MELKSRAAMIAAFGVGPLLLAAGCGGTSEEGARATLVQIQPTSFVAVEPATTTTTVPPTLPPDDGSGQISTAEQIYIVQGGDSLSRIASIHDITMEVLVNYNEWPEGADHTFFPGDEVRIPPNSLIPGTATADGGGGDGSSDVAAPTDTVDPEAGPGCQHTIVSGDNPTRVANKYEVTIEALAAANATNPVWNTFLIGSTLTIPGGGNC